MSGNDFGDASGRVVKKRVVPMRNKLKNIAAGLGVVVTLTLAALGMGAATANAAPSSPAEQAGFAQNRHWGPGYGPRPWGPRGYGHRGYGYGGYGYGDYGPPCVSGPLGFVHVCA